MTSTAIDGGFAQVRALGAAAAGDGLTGAEKLAAAVCLVYPFRIFLNEFFGIDFHLGLLAAVLFALVALATVRALPAGFPSRLDLAILAFSLLAVADVWLLTGPTWLALKGLSVEARFVVFYFAARLLRLRREFAAWLCAAMAAVGVAEAVVGVLDYHLGYGTLLWLCDRTWTQSFWKMGLPRLYSFAMDPLAVAYIFVFALAGCLAAVSAARRAWVAVALFAIWQALPLTLARAPLAFAVAMIAVFPLFDRERGLWFLRMSLCAIAAAVAVYALRGWNQPLSTYAAVGGTLADGSAVAHEWAVRRGLRLIALHPFGYGLGEAGLVAVHWGGGFRSNETYYVNLGVQMGIPGLACFVALVAASGALWLRFVQSRRLELRALGYAGGAIWFVLAIGALVSGTWNILVPQFYFWLLTGTAANVAASESDDPG